MAIKNWEVTRPKYNVVKCKVTMNGGDSSNNLYLSDFPDKTVHVYGTFNDSTVSVVGLNEEVGGSASGQALHRAHDGSLTFSVLSAEVMGLLLENPLTIQASATAGTGVGLTVVITGVRH